MYASPILAFCYDDETWKSACEWRVCKTWEDINTYKLKIGQPEEAKLETEKGVK